MFLTIMKLSGYYTFSALSYIFMFLFLRLSAIIRLIASFFTDFRGIIQTQHTRQGFTRPVISPTLKPLSDNTQHSQERDLHALSGIKTSIPANERQQTHSLDHAATAIDKSLTHSFYLAMEKHHKAQESENKLTILIFKSQYFKNNSMCRTLYHLIKVIMCVLSQINRQDQQSSFLVYLHFQTSTIVSILYFRVFTSCYQIFQRRIYCDSIQIKRISKMFSFRICKVVYSTQ